MIIEELLNIQIAKKKEDIERVKKYIAELIDSKNHPYVDLTDLYNEMQRVCEHPKEFIKVAKEYTAGGYNYKSQTKYTAICTQCNKVVDTRIDLGSYE